VGDDVDERVADADDVEAGWSRHGRPRYLAGAKSREGVGRPPVPSAR
jgi:hypothetical protein